MPSIRVRVPKETKEEAIRRFKRVVEKSGVLTTARRRRYHTKRSQERKRRIVAAVRREKKRAAKELFFSGRGERRRSAFRARTVSRAEPRERSQSNSYHDA